MLLCTMSCPWILVSEVPLCPVLVVALREIESFNTEWILPSICTAVLPPYYELTW